MLLRIRYRRRTYEPAGTCRPSRLRTTDSGTRAARLAREFCHRMSAVPSIARLQEGLLQVACDVGP